jgi:hypothetical protein
LFQLLHRYIEPAETLGELYFGFVMAMSFTLGSAAIARHNPNVADEVVWAALGCNAAWGIIDGAMFVMGRMFQRGRVAKLHEMMRGNPDRAASAAMLSQRLRDSLGLREAGEIRELEALSERLVDLSLRKEVGRNRPTAEDWIGGGFACLLVFAAAIWGALPLLFIDDKTLAIRLSNLLAILAMFAIGYKWGGYTNASPWAAGSLAAGVGVLLVVVAILLGG